MMDIFPKPHSIGVFTPLAVKNAMHFLPVTPLEKIFLGSKTNFIVEINKDYDS